MEEFNSDEVLGLVVLDDVVYSQAELEENVELDYRAEVQNTVLISE